MYSLLWILLTITFVIMYKFWNGGKSEEMFYPFVHVQLQGGRASMHCTLSASVVITDLFPAFIYINLIFWDQRSAIRDLASNKPTWEATNHNKRHIAAPYLHVSDNFRFLHPVIRFSLAHWHIVNLKYLKNTLPRFLGKYLFHLCSETSFQVINAGLGQICDLVVIAYILQTSSSFTLHQRSPRTKKKKRYLGETTQ